MNITATNIVEDYFKALSNGSESQYAQFLWDDFKEIGPQLETVNKTEYLLSLRDRNSNRDDVTFNILDIHTAGNIVKVTHSPNGTSQSQQSVFAVVGDKIKLEVLI
jgi:hypothetical protein